MASNTPPAHTLKWPAGLGWVLAAGACFHLAYLSDRHPVCACLAIGYVACLVQLARLATPQRSFYFGFAAGLLCFAPRLGFFWTIFGGPAVVLWAILAFWTGLFVALSHQALARLGPKNAALLIPLLWTGLEYFRSELYGLKFSWLSPGFAFSNPPGLAVQILGVYGTGLLAACSSVVLFRKEKLCLIALAGLACAVLIPSRRLADVPGTQIRVAGVQMEFPGDNEVLLNLRQLVKTNPAVDLIVLSEYTFDGPPPPKILSWCQTNRKYLVAGGKDPAPADNYSNTAYVIDTNGAIVFKQVKSVPIQFFKDGLPAQTQSLWNSPWGKIGICICYDLSYRRVTDRLIGLGAQALIVPTMDVAAWGARQHQLHRRVARVRAAEYGVPVFRVASSGISQLVDGRGLELATAPFPGEGAAISGILALGKPGTRPLDFILAPVSTGVTSLFAGWLLVGAFRRRGGNSPPQTP